jgi:hypothetical protein
MLKFSTAAAAALIALSGCGLSPAYSLPSPEASSPPAVVETPVTECLTPDKVIQDIKAPLTLRLEGDAFKIFKAHVKAAMPGNELPAEVDTIFVFKVNDERSFIVMFGEGCVQGATAISNKLLAKLLDDGAV